MWSQATQLRRVALILGLAGLLVGGCYNIKDEDRCLEGYHYDPEGLVCVLDLDAGLDADLDAEVTSDASADGGGASGIGDLCDVSDECTGDADYCAYSSHAGEGFCTVTGCTEGSCPSGWMCCDCTDVDWPVICADETSTMIPLFCTCPPAL